MAYTRYVYNQVNWKNKSESLETPLGKTNLNRMDSAIYYIAQNLDVAYTELSTEKFDKSDADKVIVGMPTWDNNTGILTFRFYDGTEFSVDFNIEKIPVSFSMDSAGLIKMTTTDGTEWTADIGSLIPDYVFTDSDRIAFSKTKNADGSYSVSADIKKNSITGDCLQPDYLADVKANASSAAASAKSASDSASNAAYDAKLSQSYAVGGSGVREGENDDNAKKYKELAEASKNDAKTHADEAKANGETAKQEIQNSLNKAISELDEKEKSAVSSIENAMDVSKPNFLMELSTGHLMYSGERFVFNVNSNGHLEWGLAV